VPEVDNVNIMKNIVNVLISISGGKTGEKTACSSENVIGSMNERDTYVVSCDSPDKI
jgi:hypothetical protein